MNLKIYNAAGIVFETVAVHRMIRIPCCRMDGSFHCYFYICFGVLSALVAGVASNVNINVQLSIVMMRSKLDSCTVAREVWLPLPDPQTHIPVVIQFVS
jgi:hypothetical protein